MCQNEQIDDFCKNTINKFIFIIEKIKSNQKENREKKFLNQ